MLCVCVCVCEIFFQNSVSDFFFFFYNIYSSKTSDFNLYLYNLQVLQSNVIISAQICDVYTSQQETSVVRSHTSIYSVSGALFGVHVPDV